MPIAVTMAPSPTGPDPADFTLYCVAYEPGLTDMAEQPYGIGVSCVPTPLSKGNILPPPFTLVNRIGFEKVLGYPRLTGIPPAPCTVFNAGLPPGKYTLQGLVFDSGSSGPGVSITNAIVLKVE